MIIFKKNKNGLSKNDLNSLVNTTLKKIWWVWSIVPLVGIVLGLVGLIWGEDAEDTMAAISLIVASPICLCLFYFIFRSICKSTIQTRSRLVSNGAIYEFDKTGLKASEFGENVKTISEINYAYYKKVVENETSYIFYTQNNGAFAVQKNDLVSGSLEEFNLILVTAYGENFKPFRKKI